MVPFIRSSLTRLAPDLPIPLVIAMWVNAFGAGLFYPFALLYYTRVTSLSTGAVGLILTTATLLTLAVSPVSGALVDRYGSRRLVVLSQVLEASGFLLLLWVSSAPTLILAALVVTSGSRMFYASFSALISDVSEKGTPDRAYGLVGLTQSLAGSLGGLLAGILIADAGVTGFRIMILGNACCLLASGWAISLLRTLRHEEPPLIEGRSGYRAVLADWPFVRVVLGNVLFVMCTMMPGIGGAIYQIDVLDIDPALVGGMAIFQTLFVVGLQLWIIERVSGVDRLKTIRLAGMIWILFGVAYASAILLRGEGSILLVIYLLPVIVVASLAQMLYVPTARSLAVVMARRGMQGRYVALYEASWGLAAALVPVTFGLLFDQGPVLPWLFTCGLVALGILVMPRPAESHGGKTHGPIAPIGP